MIDIGGLFSQSFTLVWRRKFLWLMGLLMGINGLVVGLARPFLRTAVPEQWLSLEYWLEMVQSGAFQLPAINLTTAELWRYVLWGALTLFVYVVLFWVIVMVAEGAIIGAAIEESDGRPSHLGRSVRLGIGYLPRFAAIDAAVFLPVFLLLLLLMVVALADTAVIAYLTLQTQTETSTVITIYALGWLCVLALGCCIPPLTIVLAWYRTLAFRDAAILHHSVRESLPHTRQVIRQRFGELLALAVLLYGLNYVLGWLFSLLMLPVLALTAVPLAAGITSPLGFVAAATNLLLSLLTALLKGMVHAFTAVAWTLAYRELSHNP
ncbi:MAG: hypothetical protein HND44_12270 [Chloroflexi bacterium]|nr:hypothetical protein [Ardenticatenaceae bacterium]MBL1129257.1 hypothetical protein [Chloroflexota bacterium]NOG35333.1 hypothetical protein [Chloroflexota bacterium]